LTGKVHRQFAYDVAQTNNLPHRFNHEDEMTGYNIYYGFFARCPEISIRYPQATSMA
jgi:hypothetical protein